MALRVNPRKIHEYTVNHVKYLHEIILQTIKLWQNGKASTIERSTCTKISRTNTTGSSQFREKLIIHICHMRDYKLSNTSHAFTES